MRPCALRTCLPAAIAAALLVACAQPRSEIVTVDVPGPWDLANYGEGQVEVGEIALVSRQVLGCWTLPDGLAHENAPDFVIRAQIDRQAVVTASELRNPDEARQDRQLPALIKSAQEALASCSPLRLPADKYESWRELDFRFSARQRALVSPWRRSARKAAGGAAETEASLGEIDEVRRQISSCWNPPVGVFKAADLAVELRVHLNRDGSVQKLEVLDGERLKDPDFGKAADAAVWAVKRCSPLSLPPARYEVWREMVLIFDPSEMLAR